mgnify:CR=1 FL=1
MTQSNEDSDLEIFAKGVGFTALPIGSLNALSMGGLQDYLTNNTVGITYALIAGIGTASKFYKCIADDYREDKR